MIKIFDSYDTEISISKSYNKTLSFDITGSQQIEIDNKGNKEIKPIVRVTTDTDATLNGDWLVNDDEIFSNQSITLDSTDELILDFENQEYKKNDTDIYDLIDFPNNKPITIKENQLNTFDITVESGSINLIFEFSEYSNNEKLHHIENFRIDGSFEYLNGEIVDESYTINIGYMPVDWSLYEDITSGEDYRIKYYEYNPKTLEQTERGLLEVKFTNWNRGFNMGEFILTNLTGSSDKLIKIN